MSIDQARQPAGVPIGGQFATTARAEPGFNLPPEVRIPIAAVATVRDTSVPLPPWPQELPAPTVSYDPGAEGPDVTVRWGDGPNEHAVFWTDEESCDVSSLTEFDTREDYAHLDPEVADAVLEYGTTVRSNIQQLTYELNDAGHTAEARRTVVALATKQPVVPTQAPPDIESRIGAWTGNPRPNEAEVRQVLAELRAYTRSVGVSDDAFARLVQEAAR